MRIDATNRFINELSSSLCKVFGNWTAQKALRLGVEIEFFLLKSENQPVGHKHSQSFLRRLGNKLTGELRTQSLPEYGEYVESICVNCCGHRFNIKYEQHPHLIEIESFPAESISELHEPLEFLWKRITEVTSNLGIQSSLVPWILPTNWDYGNVSHHPLGKRLRGYRARLHALNPDFLSDSYLMNFSAYVASQHLHVSGVPFKHISRVVRNLYSFEPTLITRAFRNCSPSYQAPQHRWRGYLSCHRGLPLVGFPDLPTWSVKEWATAMLHSPRLDQGVDSADPIMFIESCRDLQIVRPRKYGTIELRADPVMPSIRKILEQFSIRLGLFLAAIDYQNQCSVEDFSAQRAAWMKQALAKEPLNCDSAGCIRWAAQQLSLRERPELKLVDKNEE